MRLHTDQQSPEKSLDTQRTGEAPQPRTAAHASGPRDLIETAKQRMHDGLSPPAEVYQVQNRGKIDWTQFPDWARPVDPELFGDSCHEG